MFAIYGILIGSVGRNGLVRFPAKKEYAGSSPARSSKYSGIGYHKLSGKTFNIWPVGCEALIDSLSGFRCAIFNASVAEWLMHLAATQVTSVRFRPGAQILK